MVEEITKRERKTGGDNPYDEMTRRLSIRGVTVDDGGVYGCVVRGIGSCPHCDDNQQRSDVRVTVYGERGGGV